MGKIQTVKNLPVKNKRVLLRLDLNVPLEGKKIIDTSRIDAALPTIEEILKKGGRPIILSHLGRPKGKELKYSLLPVKEELEKKLNKKIVFGSDCVGEESLDLAKNLQDGEILLLENLRFHEGEENPAKEAGFVEKLAALGECYVDDAFGAAHRKHASIFYLPQFFSGKKAMGLLMEKEIYYLNQAVKDPKRPFLAIVGGAKVSSKIAVLSSLLDHVDKLLIGGALSYTFLVVQGYKMGHSLVQLDQEEEVKKIFKKAEQKKVPIFLPVDVVGVNNDQVFERLLTRGLKDDEEGRDIGQKTINLFSKEMQGAETIFWNGPVGMYEDPRFLRGTKDLLQELAAFQGQSIIGGGDLVAAANICKIVHFTHISTGGGASLEYIEKEELPGITALEEKNNN